MPAPGSLGEAILWSLVAIVMLVFMVIFVVVASPYLVYKWIRGEKDG